ncbi:MAG: SURP domain-containing protein [Janthinobacterium lividum]
MSRQFPDITNKLSAPKKVSLFERQRQEAESKKLREEAETRKALRDFEDSFADEEDDDSTRLAGADRARNSFGGGGGPPGGPRGSLGGPRHFTSSGRRDVGPGSLGPVPSLKRKNEFEDRPPQSKIGGNNSGRAPGFGQPGSSGRGRDGLGSLLDDDEEHEQRRSPEPNVRKPTMLLQSLPRNMTKDNIRDLVANVLRIEDVSILELSAADARTQRTQSAVITLTADTPISEVDSTVTTLQGQYLGYGCYLKLSRHVSTMGSSTSTTSNMHSLIETHPFGAKQAIVHPTVGGSLRNAPPPNSYGNQPPPNTYAATRSGSTQRMPGLVQVAVAPPTNIKQLKLINKTAESLLQYGSEFEDLLMSRSGIQRDEKWAWLFDSSSPGGVYYRWLVWKLCSEEEPSRQDHHSYAGPPAPPGVDMVFDSGPIWQTPSEQPKYNHITSFEEFVSDEEYVSSEDESGDEGERKQYHSGGTAASADDPDNSTRARYLNPYRRAKLTHLLARLPENIAQLRTGDVARVTNFVVNNAGQGAEEIVDMLLANVEHPYRFSVSYSDNDSDNEEFIPSVSSTKPADSKEDPGLEEQKDKNKDTSPAKLMALYLISDAIQSSSTSGVRDAWKYRALFETALTSRKTFAHLGRLEKQHAWGRLKAEQWKRKIGAVLNLWGARSVFPGEVHESFRQEFLEPPLSDEEREALLEQERKDREEEVKKRWRSAEDAARDREEQDEKAEAAKRENAKAKIEAIKAKAKAQADAQSAAKQTDTTTQQTTREQDSEDAAENTNRRARNRPTAADLFDAPPEPVKEVAPAAAAAADSASSVPTAGNGSGVTPAAPGMKIGFSLSLGGGGAAPKVSSGASPAAGTAVSKNAKTQSSIGSSDGRKQQSDIFGDLDED